MLIDSPKFKNPQWIKKLQAYPVEDAFDIVVWLHDREQGYIPLQFPESVYAVSESTDKGKELSGGFDCDTFPT